MITNKQVINATVDDKKGISGDIRYTVLKGEKGEKGDSGYTPVKGVDYFDGEKGDPGYTPIKGVDYFDGEKGDPGYTPIKGVDYFDGEKGDKGDRGEKGETGLKGDPGVSPTVATSAISGGHRVTVTDVEGSRSFDVMDGATGAKGDKGDKGDPGEVTQAEFENALDEKAPVIISSASGSIASFPDGAEMPVDEVTAQINPVQDLHGYENPWPAGGGVNKIDVNQLVSYGTTYGLRTSFDGDWIVLSGEYTNSNQAANFKIAYLKGGSAFPVTKFKAFPDSNTSSHMTSTPFGLADGNKTLTIYISGMVQGETYNLRCKIVGYEGDTAPTEWTPYANVCPISGWDSVEVQRTAINVWDEEWENGAISAATGCKYYSVNNVMAKNYISVRPNTTYYCSRGTEASSTNFTLFLYDANKTWLGANTVIYRKNGTFTTPTNAYYMLFYMAMGYGEVYNSDICINYPATATAYTPYQGDTYTIQLGQTVYGGSLDVTTGVLTVDKVMVDLGTLDWGYYQNGGKTKYYFRSLNEITNAKLSDGGIPNCISDRYKTATWSMTVDNATNDNCITFGWSRKSYIAVCDSAYSDAVAFKTAMSGVQLVYELATPITYQLTPTEVRTLLGQNNIWADAGDVSVKYNADTKLYIDNKITQAIAAALNS